MIIDHIKNFSLYIPLHRNLEKVGELLQVVEQQGFPEGVFSFDEYTITCESSTKELPLKAHKKEIIVYYTLKGTDCLGTTKREVSLPTDYMAIFLPHETHAPIKSNDEVKRVIIKVPV
jgi:beta-galactosidase beta subunit